MAHIWPIGGGKGGSGKSFLTSSLGRLLAKAGRKTLLIDLDLGAANLHTMVDVPYPEKCFSDFITKKISLLEDIVLATPFPNLFLISGAHDSLDIANLPYEKKIKTLKSIAKLKYEYIILDLGAGTAFNTLDFFLASQNGIFITTPEPTSIENVYRLMRAIYLRRIRHYFSAADFKMLEKKVREHLGDDSINKPENIASVVRKEYPEKFALIKKDFNSFHFKLILNQLRKQDNVELGSQICKIIKKHLGLHVDFAGNIAYDEHVHDAICQRVSFLDRYPHTRAANDLRELNRKMSNSLGEQLILNYL
ncbi:MAG: ATP-binding protein [Deltaproteobacteria bacterium HGW-Deltaproteobacteria-2]|jgi:flagellar biosynthesis protein FlhG|nr:MAG: ATP-binding protein [Deltaproteobacteria bacterium HGW-Deltaproteobacteria-2]